MIGTNLAYISGSYRHQGEKMKNLFFTLSAVITLSTFGASDSDDLILSGTVPEVTSITVTGNASATTLDIINGETGTLVASSSEESNSLGGYKITMHSTNNGFLQNTSNATVKTAYQINYGSAGYLTPGTSGSPVDVVTVAGTGSKITNSRNINVNVTALASAGVGTYSDTVTFTIQGL